MRILFLIVSILLTCMYIIAAVFRLNKVRRIDGFFVFQSMYMLVYGLVPMLNAIILAFDINGYDELFKSVDTTYSGIQLLTLFYLLAFLGFIVINLGYYGTIRERKKLIIPEKVEPSLYEKRARITAWICLAISIISLYFWSRVYGSIFVLIENASAIRSGRYDVTKSLAFFKHPAKIIMICALLFFCLLRISKGRRKIEYSCGFVISVIGSYLYLMANDGKTVMLTFILGFIWIWQLKKRIRSVPKFLAAALLLAVAVIWVALRLDNITAYIRYGVWNSVDRSLLSIINEYQYTLRSGQTALSARLDQNFGYTFITDFMSGINAWLPTKIKIGNFDTIWHINTSLLYGASASGTSPSSFVATAYYDLGFIGILAFSFLAGKLIYSIDRYIKTRNQNPFALAISARLMVIFFNLPGALAMSDLALNMFPIAASALIYWIIARSVARE